MQVSKGVEVLELEFNGNMIYPISVASRPLSITVCGRGQLAISLAF